MTRAFFTCALGLATLAGWALVACDSTDRTESETAPCCDRTACEAAEQPQAARAVSQGIVGVVSFQTDYAVNCDCFDCTWSDASIAIWNAPEPVRDEDVARALREQPKTTIADSASARYEQHLDEGHYLVCLYNWPPMWDPCAAVDVQAGELFTVNWGLGVFNFARVILFDPTGTRRDDLVFENTQPDGSF